MTTTETKEQSIMASLNKSNELIGQIDLAELPSIINAQVVQINTLGAKIEDALASAESAKVAAEEAGKLPIGLGHKKKALDGLQKSGKQSAEAISDTVDALKLSFEYEKQLGEISKFLIALGAYSAEHTRQTIAQLKAEILDRGTGASLSDVAKKQLMQVISQLEVQGETIKRQEALEQEISEQQALLDEMEEQDEQQDAQIAQNAETLSAHKKALAIHQEENERQDREILDLQEQDEQQDNLIAENARGISKAQKSLEAQQQKDAEHDQRFEEMAEDDDKQDALIARNAKDIADMQDRINKLEIYANKLAWKIAVSVVAASAFVLSLLQVFGIF